MVKVIAGKGGVGCAGTGATAKGNIGTLFEVLRIAYRLAIAQERTDSQVAGQPQ